MSQSASKFVNELTSQLDHLGVGYRLEGYVEGEGRGRWIKIAPVNEAGFSVEADIRGDDEYVIVWYRHMSDGWYEEYELEDPEAINCFLGGVLGERRLAVTKRGSYPISWSAETREDGHWVPVGTKTRTLFSPFWRKRTIEYFRNDRAPREPDE